MPLALRLRKAVSARGIRGPSPVPGWGLGAQTPVGLDRVVLLLPCREDRPGHLEAGEPVLREALSPNDAVEGLDAGLSLGLAGWEKSSSTPFPYAEASSAREVSAVPLSTLVRSGSTPRATPAARTSSATPAPENDRSVGSAPFNAATR